MHWPRIILVLLAVIVALPGVARTQASSSELLEAAIAHHDPEDSWATGRFRLTFSETRPDGPSRETVVVIDNRGGTFGYTTRRDGALIEGKLEGQDCTYLLNGSADFTQEERDEYRLTCDRLAWIRNYYVYLWGLPMKLEDEGANLEPTASAARFDGREAEAIRVTYDEAVGKDIWYFYFDPETHALIGYRFYHDEAANDGEYILLEGVEEGAGLKLPKARTWYTHAEDKLLGTDTLVSIETVD